MPRKATFEEVDDMLTTDELRALIDGKLAKVRAGETVSITLSQHDLAVMVKMDMEDALKALGTSQRVLRSRYMIVQALKTCDALIDGLATKESAAQGKGGVTTVTVSAPSTVAEARRGPLSYRPSPASRDADSIARIKSAARGEGVLLDTAEYLASKRGGRR